MTRLPSRLAAKTPAAGRVTPRAVSGLQIEIALAIPFTVLEYQAAAPPLHEGVVFLRDRPSANTNRRARRRYPHRAHVRRAVGVELVIDCVRLEPSSRRAAGSSRSGEERARGVPRRAHVRPLRRRLAHRRRRPHPNPRVGARHRRRRVAVAARDRGGDTGQEERPPDTHQWAMYIYLENASGWMGMERQGVVHRALVRRGYGDDPVRAVGDLDLHVSLEAERARLRLLSVPSLLAHLAADAPAPPASQLLSRPRSCCVCQGVGGVVPPLIERREVDRRRRAHL